MRATSELVSVNASYYLLSDLDDADLHWMIAAGSVQTIRAGTSLATRGEPMDGLYVVISGELSVRHPRRRTEPIATWGAGEGIGLGSILDGRPAACDVVATRDSRLFHIRRELCLNRARANTAFAVRMYRAMAIAQTNRLETAIAHQASVDDRAEADEMSETNLDSMSRGSAKFIWFVGQVPK